VFRGNVGRHHAGVLLGEKQRLDEVLRNSLATTLQALVRGFLLRMQLRRTHINSAEIRVSRARGKLDDAEKAFIAGR
jgi:hypothetical protein